MMKKSVLAPAVLLLCGATAVFAAKPTSIAFSSYANTEEGEKFAQYVVKCSNGKSQPITAWDNRRSWCVGDESRENCHNKQMKAANAACKIK